MGASVTAKNSKASPWIPAFAGLSWVGIFVHNVADLPGQTVLSPESSVPLLLAAALVGLWFTRRRVGAVWGLLALGLLHLAGAIVSVLPLAILPFDPDQTLKHYAFHLLYGLTQLPLVITTAAWLRRHRRGNSPATPG
ncbi:hypothetical protein QNO08_11915 [Arthrobacter sp. zg-Y820]|uniref:hypothetical protein n=1 Tax=unclassified Arthrobacter TaxID=235627 RepID=UPI001E4BE525|nr:MULTISPECIES: hypothetical protein [unclassified Arthrobacter]MCC9196179.1 hypothetical protein [Arthrobacter sp. zg-Y820]MDK1279039.1 hypothetical protein [Arthrobacter sp. zg.Y820]WIB08551.1 hypothetical protein QNO08_11915 [Arthrobacter sp. zg-Y820]